MSDYPLGEAPHGYASTVDKIIASRATPLVFILFILLSYGAKLLIIVGSCGWEKYRSDACQPSSSEFSTILANGLGELSSTLMAMLGLGLILIFLARREERRILITEPPQRRIAATVIAATKDTRSWHFMGGTGTFLKAATLPALADTVKRESTSIRVVAILIDPRDKELCREYAEVQRLNQSRSPDPAASWSEAMVRQHCLATIMSQFVYAAREPRLKLEIYLTDRMSHFRYDMSDQMLIVTREQSSAPGIQFRRGTFYESYRAEMDITVRQSRRIIFPPSIRVDDDGLSIELTRRLLDELATAPHGTNFAEGLSEGDLAKIIEYTRKPNNPFPR